MRYSQISYRTPLTQNHDHYCSRAGPFRSKVAATAVWVIHTQPTAANRQPYHQKPSIKPFLHLTSAFHHFDLNRIIDNNFDLFYLTNHLKARNSLFLPLTLHTSL